MQKLILYIPYLLMVILLNRCAGHSAPRPLVEPTHFSARFNFLVDRRGILLPTYWGAERKKYALFLDNHSPSWINNSMLQENVGLSKSNEFLYSTSTADGKKIAGDVYIARSIDIGTIRFKNVVLYNIPGEANWIFPDGTIGKAKFPDGTIGENIMSEAVWELDFKYKQVTMASEIDSIKESRPMEKLPATFTARGIEMEVQFGNNRKEKIALDLGYNNSIILPAASFANIFAGSKKLYKTPAQFSTPAAVSEVENTVNRDTVQIGSQRFNILVTTNSLATEKLAGLELLRLFDFIIIDYPNRQLYVSKTDQAVH